MSTHNHPKYSPNHILSQKDPRLVALNAFEIALELALLGKIEAATRLFTLVEPFATENKSTWSPGLYFAWEASGLWPDSIPPEQRTEEAIHKLEIERVLWKRSTCATDSGLENLINIATGFGRTDKWGDPIIKGEDLKAAIDLAAYMNKPEEVDRLLHVFAENFDSVWYRLARSRLVWPYLKDGALAKAIGVDEEKLRNFATEVYTTFSQRLANGPNRPLGDLSMSDLISLCNTNTLKNAVWEEMDGIDPSDPPTSITYPGAHLSEITALEEKLGMKLADDYKEFLSLSNGLGPLWNGFHFDPELLPANAVTMTNGTKEQKRMHKASADIGFFMKMGVKWEPLSRVIQINNGSESSKFVWLIPPEDVRLAGEMMFNALQQLPDEAREHVAKMLGNLHNGVEGLTNLEWIVTVWCPETMELANYHTFREYLEVVVGETANVDLLHEEDGEGRLLHAQDIVAFTLR